MAVNKLAPESIGDLLYVYTVGFKGYKHEILAQLLSKLEKRLIICPICDGITREAIICEGKTKCYNCRDSSEFESNDDVRNTVNFLEAICPLNIRGCHWRGKLGQVEKHLIECDQLMIPCTLNCETILAKLDEGRHQSESCPMRELQCEYCKEMGLAMNVNDHLISCSAYLTARQDVTEMKTLSTPPQKEMMDLTSLLQQFQMLNGKVSEMENIVHQQKGRIESQNKEIIDLQNISDKQNKQICDLKVVVEKQNCTITLMKTENNTNVHTCLYIMKVASGEDLTVKDFEMVYKFDWKITDIHDLIRKQGTSVEGPTFNLYKYSIQCQGYFAAYRGLDIGSLSIGLKSVPRDSDRSQELHICYYCIQLVNRKDERESIVEKGKMESIINGEYLYLASFHDDYLSSAFVLNNSITIRIQLIPTYL